MNNIELKNVVKEYPNFKLHDVNFSVPKRSIVGLIGENGAGKTTLIKGMLDIIKFDQGEIRILGTNNIKDAKEDIGVVLDGSFFAEILRVKNINPIMKRIYQNWDEALFLNYISQFEIPLNQTIKTLSKGMRKKLEIITALSHHPKLLILDEPTSGLDPIVRKEILDIFQDFIIDENNSILLSTHITSDLEHIADYIALIDKGNMKFMMTRDELLDNYGILKCNEDILNKISSNDVVRVMKNRYSYDVLVKDKRKMKKLYPNEIVDTVTIEDIMLLYIKGEEK